MCTSSREDEKQPLVSASEESAVAAALGKNVPKKPNDGKTATGGGVVVVDSGGEQHISLRRLLPSLYVVLALSLSFHLAGLSVLAEDALVAAARTLVQLSCLGAILSPLFRSPSVYPALAYVLCFMLPLAAYEASARSALTYPGATRNVLAGLCAAVVAAAAVALFGVLRPTPRLGARQLVPLAGMLLSNSLSGASLALDRLLDGLDGSGAPRLEAMLSFGATPSEASYPAVAGAIASAMVPTLNSMNVIGLVAIPGMMTGQILGGSNPTKAARYQIMIMFLIAGAAGMASGITCWLTVKDAFDARGVFLAERIVEQRSARVSKLLAAGPSGVLASWFGSSSVAGSHQSLDEADDAKTVVLQPEGAVSPPEVFVGSKPAQPLFSMDMHGTLRGGIQPFHASLSLSPGSVTTILGPSGMGKSTILKLMAELSGGGALDTYGSSSRIAGTQHSPPSSSIRLHGRERSSYPPHEWRRRVLYVPQSSSSGLPGTPREFLADVAALRVHASGGVSLDGATDAAAALLSEWGLREDGSTASSLSSPLDRPWSDLSGGEGQRVLLAIALSVRPDVLLLDEATGALDEETKRRVEGSLMRRAGGNGGGGGSIEDGGWSCAVVMVTHDEEQASRMAGAGTVIGQYRLVKEKGSEKEIVQ